MALNAPIFTWCPSYEPELEYAPDLLLAQFGDGYSQAAPNGLNHVRRRWTLNWNSEDQATADAIRDFLIERGFYQPFYFADPAGTQIGLYTCRTGLRRRQNGPRLYTLSATFEESFALPNQLQPVLDAYGDYDAMVAALQALEDLVNGDL